MCSAYNVLFLNSSDTFLACCYDVVCCYICCQQAAIALQMKPDWAYFYLISIAFILVLNWIHSFVLELPIAS